MQVKFGAAGVTAREIDLTGPVTVEPSGVPAGIIGTAKKGPAFVPVTVGIFSDWTAKFGETDGKKYGPLAVNEWLRNAQAVTYVRVLGVGKGLQRDSAGSYIGRVGSAGFVVGEKQPDPEHDGTLVYNPYANNNGIPGRTYFLGCLMSESAGSTYFSDAGLQGAGSVTPGNTTAVPIVRGIVMAPSGVILRLSSSAEGTNTAPASTYVAVDTTANGVHNGAVILTENSIQKQDFVMLLNGHKGTDPLYPNVITASFDMTAPNYFANVLNTDPYKYQEAGHYLYAHWDIHPVLAVVTGTGVVLESSGAGGGYTACTGKETSAFITSGSSAYDVPTATAPDYENFEDRFAHGYSPWIISQKFGGTPINLFRVHRLDAGTPPDTDSIFKVSIENLVPSTDDSYDYGTFDLVLRAWTDRDETQSPLEQWRGLSLDPSNDRYIAKVIGDLHAYYEFDRSLSEQKLVVDGNYPNKSNWIRVEMDTDVDDGIAEPTALPVGFRGIDHLVTSGSAPICAVTTAQHTVNNVLKRTIEPPLPMRKDITKGSGGKKNVNPLLYWGVQFEHVANLSQLNASYLRNDSIWGGFSKYFPSFFTAVANFSTGSNWGQADSSTLTILDADRFCYNMFSLENIQVVTASTTLADPQQWLSATYVRNGAVSTSESTKQRAWKVDDLTTSNRRYAKFSFFVQGGFDGVNIFDQNEAELTNIAVSNDFDRSERGGSDGPNVQTWRKAIDVMKNTTIVDIKLLAIPGIRHPVVTDYATDATEERFDAMYIMDIEEVDQDGNHVVSSSMTTSVYDTTVHFQDRGLDSSFAAAYFPDVIVQDPTTKTNVIVPPSTVVIGAMALNDSIGYPWFAPAGFARGALSTTLETRVKLNKDNMDTLYDANINPLVAFPTQSGQGLNPSGGVIVWGQRTLQAAASALDRVNVRRLLIEIRRQCREIARTITFEPNRETTLANFSAAITPRLQKIQSLSGVEAYKVVIDSSTTTQQDIENNTIRGKVFVIPTRSIEYVSLDFVVSNSINQVP